MLCVIRFCFSSVFLFHFLVPAEALLMVMCDCLHEYLVHVRVWGEGRRVVWGNHFGYIVLVYIYSMLWSVTFLKRKYFTKYL